MTDGSWLVFEEVFYEEEDVGGAFGQAAHEVGVPLRAKGDVDADAVVFGGQATLQVAADAVEHLEFEGFFVDPVVVDEGAHLVDDGFVVGGNATEDAFAGLWVLIGGHTLHQVDVVGIDVRLGGEGYFGAFFVGTLAETDANSFAQQAVGVGVGAVEVSLKNRASCAGKFCGEALGHRDGGFGVERAFHIDADEGVNLSGVRDHLADDALGEGWVEVHADLREFDADVGVELARGDGVEELVVDVSRFLRLGFRGHAFAASESSGVAAMPSRFTRSQTW